MIIATLIAFAVTKPPVTEIVEAWAYSRKLSVVVKGKRATLKSKKGHCYDGVVVELSGLTAKATGKDGHDCDEPERLEIVGYKRDGDAPLWLITQDSPYGSTIAVYTLANGKLRLEKELTAMLPSTASLLPSSDERGRMAFAPHYYLDETGLRAVIDLKQAKKLCPTCTEPLAVALKWNGATFTEDSAGTARALADAIASAAALEPVAPTPQQEQEEGPRRRPLK